VIKQVLGDIGKDHVPSRAEPFRSAEGDEAVTGAHVKNCLTGRKTRFPQHRIAHRVQEPGEILLPGSGITPNRTSSSQRCQRSVTPPSSQ
jgi:hypothetical protein